jgi:hypothetical protein
MAPPQMPTNTQKSLKLSKEEVEDVQKLGKLQIYSVTVVSKRTLEQFPIIFKNMKELELDFETVWQDSMTGKDTPAIARIHTSPFQITHKKEDFGRVCASWILIYCPRAYAVICLLS